MAVGVGCSPPVTTGDSGGNDAAADAPATPGMTYNYVLRQLTIDEQGGMISDSPDIAHTGFNVDNHFSGPTDPEGCNHEDFFSTIDPDQNRTPTCNMAGCGGVDNQLPTLAGSLAGVMPDLNINARVAEEINAGRLALLLSIADVNDLTNDDSVRVRIALGYPTFANCSDLFSGTAEFQLQAGSLTAGGTTIDQATFSFPGAIVNGRLRVMTDANATFLLPLPEIMGIRLELNLHTPQLRVSLNAQGFNNGNLGGWVAGGDLVSAVVRAAPSYEMAARMIIAGLVDVQVGGVCTDGTGAMTRYGGVSLGLGMQGVPARISSMAPATARTAGTCGYSAPADGGM